MMAKLVVFIALVVPSLAIPPAAIFTLLGGPKPQTVQAPQTVKAPQTVPIAILRSESNIAPDGSHYEYLFDTENGISVQQTGDLVGTPPDQGIAARGSYSYTSPEGVPVVINYIADVNGYQPTGDVIPTPPPVPPAILRALAYIEAHPETSKE